MADVIDLNTRRRGSAKAEPSGSLTCTFDVAPGMVTVALRTPTDGLEICLSPEGAQMLASRLTVAAIRARLQSENGGIDG